MLITKWSGTAETDAEFDKHNIMPLEIKFYGK